jgi:hypothetical protein
VNPSRPSQNTKTACTYKTGKQKTETRERRGDVGKKDNRDKIIPPETEPRPTRIYKKPARGEVVLAEHAHGRSCLAIKQDLGQNNFVGNSTKVQTVLLKKNTTSWKVHDEVSRAKQFSSLRHDHKVMNTWAERRETTAEANAGNPNDKGKADLQEKKENRN